MYISQFGLCFPQFLFHGGKKWDVNSELWLRICEIVRYKPVILRRKVWIVRYKLATVRKKKSEMWDKKFQLPILLLFFIPWWNFFLRDVNSELWETKTKLWYINTELWETKSELWYIDCGPPPPPPQKKKKKPFALQDKKVAIYFSVMETSFYRYVLLVHLW